MTLHWKGSLVTLFAYHRITKGAVKTRTCTMAGYSRIALQLLYRVRLYNSQHPEKHEDLLFKVSVVSFVSLCCLERTPILLIQCDPLENGCGKILHPETKRTSSLSFLPTNFYLIVRTRHNANYLSELQLVQKC